MSDRKHPQKDDAKVEVESAAESSPKPSANSPESAPQGAVDAAALAEQLASLQAEKDELWQTLIRRQADFENYRKRIERERREEDQRAVARVVEGMLPVLDAFERALAPMESGLAAHDDPAYEEYRKGFELIYRQLWDALSRQGLERIEAEGKVFDPHVHHAIERVESEEHADGTVLEVLQHGYAFRGKVLRPTTVRVAIHPGEKSTKVREKAN